MYETLIYFATTIATISPQLGASLPNDSQLELKAREWKVQRKSERKVKHVKVYSDETKDKKTGKVKEEIVEQTSVGDTSVDQSSDEGEKPYDSVLLKYVEIYGKDWATIKSNLKEFQLTEQQCMERYEVLNREGVSSKFH